MAAKKSFTVIYDEEVYENFRFIDRKYYALIGKEIKSQLFFEPEKETRNKKPLLRPSVFGTAWELRLGPDNRFRVFYRTDARLREVYVLAVGVKVKERLYIGGKEFML